MTHILERLFLPVCLALLVHGVALYGLLRTYNPTMSEMVAPVEPIINATVVEMQARQKPAKRKPIVVPEAVPKPKERVNKKAVRPKPALTKVEKSDAGQAEPAPDDARTREAREALAVLEQAAFDEALDAEVEALTAADDDSVVASYIGRIRDAVQSEWIRPPGARNGMQVVLLVELVPTGEVVSVAVVRGSGSDAFDRSAVAAVNKARKFEVPEDRDLFERVFRRFHFKFNPEDLLR